MPSLGKTSFDGESGETYRFTVYPLRTRIRKIAGLYIIANRSHDDSSKYLHEALFVGQTEDLSQSFEKHHKAREFERLGANCICLHADKSQESRIEKKRDLIANLRPVCDD